MEPSGRVNETAALQLGGDRFLLQRILGRGAMGIVYAAYDQKRRMPVALKMLRMVDPISLFQFKNEFRALSDITHPNLVTLYELLSEGNLLYFTMELVTGVDLLRFVRPLVDGDISSNARTLPLDHETLTNVHRKAPSGVTNRGELDIERLRIALPHVVHGVMALHTAGKLHRDIKPSNILVPEDGRARLCDFGLVASLGSQSTAGGEGSPLVGTVAYMSPEQAACGTLTEASDWYSVGATLYRTLTGVTPYPGDNLEVLSRKQHEDPRPPSRVDPEVPSDLEELCVDLLSRDPAKRPTGEQVLARLAGHKRTIARPAARVHVDPAFVGRRSDLDALDEALGAVRAGTPVVMLVRGRSGMGKSTLVRHFLDQATASGAVALAGRCYERESVPFKGLDSLVDALANHLGDVLRDRVDDTVARNMVRVARLFPVMRAIADNHARGPGVVDGQSPQELRNRGFAALRGLLRWLGERATLILHLDDLQRGDADSLALLAEILRPPEAPRMLLVASYRSEDEASSELLRELASRRKRGELGDVRDLTVDALSDGDARELAAELLGTAPGDSLVAHVAAESGGSPFFLQELARYFETRTLESRSGPILLDTVLRSRLQELPAPARALLSVVSVAGQPLERRILEDAAPVGTAEEQNFALLRSERFVRSKAAGELEEFEPYHDRIREAAVALLEPDELKTQHLRFAVALSASDRSDLDAPVEHWLGAGDHERAAKAARAAAEQAERGLAFERAARLFALALEHGTWEPEDERRLRITLGDALVNAGRVVLASEEYLRAAKGAPDGVALDLKRRAAVHLLRSARVDEGLVLMREVLAAVGMSLPSSPSRALTTLLLRRAQLRLRGLDFRERKESDVSADVLARIDTCWTASTGLCLVDPIRGSAFQTKHLLMALQAGEPSRVAAGLGIEAGYMATFADPWAAAREKHLLETARDLSERLGQPHAIAVSLTTAGIAAFMRGQCKRGHELFVRGERIFRDECTGVAWELAAATLFGIQCLYSLGEIAELVRNVPTRLREAEERGDVYLAGSLRTWRSHVVWLATDKPEEGRAQLEEARRMLPQEGFYLQRYFDVDTAVNIELYLGRGVAAHAIVQDAWAGMKKAFLLQVQNMRIETTALRARTAIAAAKEGHDATARLNEAEADAKRLERERTPTSLPYALSIQASVRFLRGQRAEAFTTYERAVEEFERASMKMHAAAARIRLGTVRRGQRDAELVANAEKTLRRESIRRPDRIAAMLVP
ncbi:serine/threonine protein kinase [Labilithrix luteola]|uniref:Serine/threonine protein kinase n=1 Tax=Labilithrix luteola TaxID=1391654 RepID=A0A0K1PRR7_9BACT|nr:serine/threonine-protein kinase [Labilithrix luteola]AKU96218.1 serine/threonine protein kinase [Labilithrix luteola]